MAAAIPPRPEDVYGGGGSFSACLSRAIRHSSTNIQTQNANNNSGVATPTTTDGVDSNIVPPQEDQLIDNLSSNAAADNQRDGANNNDDNTQEESQSLTQTPIKIPRAPSSIEYKTPQRRAPRWDSSKSNEQQQQGQDNANDWSQHHISYNKLRSTLDYFSKRRSLLRTKLRSSTTTTVSANTGGGGGSSRVLTEEEFNVCVTECGIHAPFLNNNNLDNAEGRGSLKNYDRAGKVYCLYCYNVHMRVL